MLQNRLCAAVYRNGFLALVKPQTTVGESGSGRQWPSLVLGKHFRQISSANLLENRRTLPVNFYSSLKQCQHASKWLRSHSGINHTSLYPIGYMATGNNTSTLRTFHTTPRSHIHPMIWFFVKPLAKVASIITGRSLRKQWQKMPDSEKESVKEVFGLNKTRIAIAIAFLMACAGINYVTHLQETPITHRKRYLAFTPSQLSKIVEFELEQQMTGLEDKILPPNHRAYKYVTKVATKIVDSNQDLDFFKNQTWRVVVIDSDEKNAFVLPTGHIFVFLGLLNTVNSEDQLAVVLGHEMAHAVLTHAAEQLSFAQILDVIVIFSMAAIWFFMPTDGIAVVTQWFYNKVMQLMLHLPYSRKQEAEADEVGLQLIAKACYDVRESSSFWNTMFLLGKEEEGTGEDIPEWLSTHPSHEKRANTLDTLIPKAIELRDSCKCTPLPKKDPRDDFQKLRAIVSDTETKDLSMAVPSGNRGA